MRVNAPTSIRPRLALAGALLTLPAAAAAEVIEIGKIAPPTQAGLPGKPCLAVSRTTGYQAKVGTDARPHDRPGRRPDRRLDDRARQARQEADRSSSTRSSAASPQAQITILDPQRKLRSRAVAPGPAA